MRRAAWRARSAASAAVTWSRSRRSTRSRTSSTSCCWKRCWQDLRRTITGHAGTVGERLDEERRVAEQRCRASVTTPVEQATPQGGQQGAGDGPHQPLLGAGVALAGLRVGARGRRQRNHVLPRRPRGRPPRAPCAASTAPARSSTTTSSCWSASPARWRGRWRCARSATAATGPACFDELWAAIAERAGAKMLRGRWSTC